MGWNRLAPSFDGTCFRFSILVMNIICFLVLGLTIVATTMARIRRCYVCRSRGPLGDCKDPFWWNTTTVAANPAIEMSPCASGWCGKAVDGKDGDHLQATERMCLQRPPTDGQERCSETFYENHRQPIFMCFCRGDLCNSSNKLLNWLSIPLIVPLIISMSRFIAQMTFR